jgi:hypothetical protein
MDDDTANPTATVTDGAMEEEEAWSFLCIDVPGSDKSCCGWACADCDLCDTAREYDSPKVMPLTTLLCCFSFGRSSWYSRSLCGTRQAPASFPRVCGGVFDCDCGTWLGLLFPVFLGLVILFLVVDLVYVLLAFTLLILLVVIALPFFLLCRKPNTTATTTPTTSTDHTTATPEPQAS